LLVEADQVREFLDPLSVRRLWGVGKVTGQVFERLSIRRVNRVASRKQFRISISS